MAINELHQIDELRREIEQLKQEQIFYQTELDQYKRREDVWRRNDIHVKDFFNHAAIGFVVIDSKNRFVEVNPRTCAILNYTRDELLDKTVTEITAPEDRTKSEDLNQKLQSRELDIFDYEKRYLKKDGSPLWVHVTVSAIRDKWGQHIYSIGTIEDISNRKIIEEELTRSRGELKENEERLRLVIEAANLGVWDFDIETGIANHSFRHDQIFGYSEPQPEWSYEISVEHILPEFHKEVRDSVGRAIETGILSYDAKVQWPDGSIHWIAPRGRVYYDKGKPLRMAGIVSDITEQKKAELEIRQRNEELTRFIYTVSHDLKSPLVTIKSFTSFLKEDIADKDQEALEKDIRYIENAADKMGKLLDELLELSRVGRKEESKTEISLQTTVQSAIDLVAGRISSKNVKVFLSAPPVMLYGHTQRLVQLYQNMIDNAVKFMGKQADPVIEIGAFQDKDRNGEVVLFVKDNGQGIDPRYHHKLFGLFEKLDNSTEGTGIGLALVKRIVETHGGSIWFTSEPEAGTTFFFTLKETKILKNH